MDPTWKPKVAAETARELRRTATASEGRLWQVLRNRGLDGSKFRRQHRIGPFVVDFCCIEHRLVVEIDGPVHIRTRPADRERQALIEAEGYKVIRISAHRAETDLAGALETIRKELQPSPPAPLPRAGEGCPSACGRTG